MREILRKHPRPRGTVYGTRYAIRFTQNKMPTMPVLFNEAPADTVKLELRSRTHFASCSTVTSTATLLTQRPAGCTAQADPPRAPASLKDPRKWRK